MRGYERGLGNRVMGALLEGLFIVFPLSCAAVAGYEIWLHGFGSPLLQMALGIFAVYFGAKAILRTLAAIDDTIDALRNASEWAEPRVKAARIKLADFAVFQPRQLSRVLN